jgi:hypothetical protein
MPAASTAGPEVKSGRMLRALARGVLLAAVFAALDRPAHAQAAVPDGHGYDVASRVSVGGEMAVNIAPVDTTGYFNHTDYNHDALRRIRLSLQAEFRASPTLALVGEVRSDNGVDVTAPAFYLRGRARPLDLVGTGAPGHRRLPASYV